MTKVIRFGELEATYLLLYGFAKRHRHSKLHKHSKYIKLYYSDWIHGGNTQDDAGLLCVLQPAWHQKYKKCCIEHTDQT